MDVYCRRFAPKKVYRISANNFGKAGNIVSVPLYAAHLCNEICNED